MDKKEFLLHSIIKAYIEHLEPIGSSQLKSMYDISYSPATIRGYFKKLGDEGFLAQEHVSSGRTPTTEALKMYWRNKLNFRLEYVDERAIAYLSNDLGMSVFIQDQKSDILKNILNVENRYMILEFTSFAITIKYSDALYRFLSDMVSLELVHIVNIAKQVGAMEIYEQVSQYLQNKNFHIYNTKEFFSLALKYNFDEKSINSFLKGVVLDSIEEGLYFDGIVPEGYIGICHKCRIDNQDIKMLVVGELSKDYEYFYNKISMV
ncbi:heat-shock protein [Arcobacter arenosus]|jgi:heat-inducible transcriptional repressor|uniref:Heat-shock protein n=1 Tax=Arcobacter arenosus TaxID=2576037 RepID=A0A5R8Y1E1_9BACT|nr:heat-shock protein [Arcobacter arenosus]TLP38500.1 heat-shock protein [Arcobacter arenosus]